ncbi:MAG TPA: ATP phosphoribosyltransferase regulatory subunit, partial [Pseudomonadales bacterium]|nr:ATP phosphoribosyltransferase regulatory subunit [Pseudomonadales bacterium]
LDSKDPNTQRLLNDAPQLLNYLDDDSRAHFEELQAILTAAGVKFEINPRLVRGLDYYCKTVFEWVTSALGAQGTVCAGGRYDGLVEQLGGKSTPAVGFAMGVERLVLLLETCGLTAALEHKMDVYIIAAGVAEKRHSLVFAEQLRSAAPYVKVQVHCGGGKFKQQFKKADESGAQLAIIIGETELQTDSISIKQLRAEDSEQITLPVDRGIEYIADYFNQ